MSTSNQLQQHISRICQLHPWYNALLSEQRTNLNPYELNKLPLMTAELLEKHYYTQESRAEKGLSIYKTSGTSSGIRKSIYYSQEDDESYIAAKTACFHEWLTSGAASTGNSKPLKKALADMGTGHAASTALTIFERLGFQSESLSFALPIEEHLEKLASFRPELLYTMPSILDAIASASNDPQQYGIQKIILVGEMAPLHWQANIAARFGITPEHILDTYGSIEIGAIASYSHKLGLYIIGDDIAAEALPAEQIDPHFEPLQAGESVLILTSYSRSMFPAVRYVTYDVVRDFQTIVVDGKQKQGFRCIAKRIGTDLKHGEKISLYDIENVVQQFAQDAELRVRLRDNKLSVHIRSKCLDDEQLVHIQHAIEHTIIEVGLMIQNRILDGITVTLAAEGEQLERGAVKSKKIYF